MPGSRGPPERLCVQRPRAWGTAGVGRAAWRWVLGESRGFPGSAGFGGAVRAERVSAVTRLLRATLQTRVGPGRAVRCSPESGTFRPVFGPRRTGGCCSGGRRKRFSPEARVTWSPWFRTGDFGVVCTVLSVVWLG